MLERFQQVIDRLGIECLDRLLIESGHKNNCRHMYRVNRFKHAKAVDLWHLHVQEHQAGLVLDDATDGGLSVGALSHNFKTRIGF